MTEQETVHEEVQTDSDSMTAGGEDVASSVDRSPCDSPIDANEGGPNRRLRTAPSPQSSVLVSDAKRYRKRAQAAEQELEELKVKLAASEKTLQEREQAIAALGQQRQIDRMLEESGAIDQDAVRVLIESAMKEMPQADVAEAVKELRRCKPYLFRQERRRGKPASGAMGVRDLKDEAPRQLSIEHAAEAALETGKRIDLLRYLRLRRRAK